MEDLHGVFPGPIEPDHHRGTPSHPLDRRLFGRIEGHSVQESPAIVKQLCGKDISGSPRYPPHNPRPQGERAPFSPPTLAREGFFSPCPRVGEGWGGGGRKPRATTAPGNSHEPESLPCRPERGPGRDGPGLESRLDERPIGNRPLKERRAMIRTPLGLRLFPNTSVREQIQEAARLGARGVVIDAIGDLGPDRLTETGRRELRHLLRSVEVSLIAMHLPTRRSFDTTDQLDDRLGAPSGPSPWPTSWAPGSSWPASARSRTSRTPPARGLPPRPDRAGPPRRPSRRPARDRDGDRARQHAPPDPRLPRVRRPGRQHRPGQPVAATDRPRGHHARPRPLGGARLRQRRLDRPAAAPGRQPPRPRLHRRAASTGRSTSAPSRRSTTEAS